MIYDLNRILCDSNNKIIAIIYLLAFLSLYDATLTTVIVYNIYMLF